MTHADIHGGRARRRELFETRLEPLMDRLYGTALRLTRDPNDAEDVVAEAIGKAWSRLDDLRDMDQFESWLFRILNNTFISTCRRRRCRQDREVSMDDDGGETAPETTDFSLFRQLHQPFLLWWGTPEEDFLNGLLREDIQRALDSLPDPFRVVVVLVDIQGCTYEETATQLDVAVGTVRSRLNRGRGLLQKALWRQAQDAGLHAPKPRDQTHSSGERR
ncbi:sigma-70 family RNA polymerase sigma factor [Halofilum ochraceum]|uniref:sigma-70 family RNA polymerase sigma factor n=1 Tax=Halofilum ochraceum TaxID=1611323 RepID=UPI000946EF12|nr:sigma-70 family RNA polymerase sigma factor [Halofilum ochraceum]